MFLEDRLPTLAVFVDADQFCDWSCLSARAESVREIIAAFARVPSSGSRTAPRTTLSGTAIQTWAEIVQAASVTGCSPLDILAANTFYDSSRGALGCTAFAVDSPGGPLHGHCLDWEFGAEILGRHLTPVDLVEPGGRTTLRSVGWPGFLGTYVGVSPGRFALTMNAVWSEDEACEAEPLGIILRRAMTASTGFAVLVDRLASVPLRCDCVLLVTGVNQGEMVVIERTPTRAALREPSSSVLLATNHYCALEAGASRPGYVSTGREPFGAGTRERYDAACTRLASTKVDDVDACSLLLGGPPFMHETTVLRTAMRASTGQLVFSPAFHEPTVVSSDAAHGDAAREA